MGTSSPKGAQFSQVSAHVCCGQMAGCIKVQQGATWYGGRQRPRRHCVRWEPPKKGHSSPHFGPCLLWPNGCMNHSRRSSSFFAWLNYCVNRTQNLQHVNVIGLQKLVSCIGFPPPKFQRRYWMPPFVLHSCTRCRQSLLVMP